ncbi:MAG: phosphatidate cytidylyltransferase [Pirellulales bacterium]
MSLMDLTTFGLVGAVLALLGAITGVGQLLKRQTDIGLNPAVIEQFNLRVRAWWLLCAVLAVAFLAGREATVLLFGLLSFWALREFITLTPTRMADHRALFWVFFLFTPLQYLLVGADIYELYSVVIPVYAFLFIPARIAFAGDYKRYLERCAKIQAGLMICVYCLSYAPALLYLDIARHVPSYTQNARLLFFFLLVVTLGDAFQYVSEKLFGKHVIAPAISPNRTWEGYLGGVGCATLFGTVMWWATPFSPLEAAGMSVVITTMGFAGGMTMSAIKRDRGVKDYGTLVEGHGGVLDRIDSTCFAAPVFYHFTRLLFPS